MPEQKPGPKWSFCYLWEHFLVPEHRIPIWVILGSRFRVEDIVEDMKLLIFQYTYAQKLTLLRICIRVTR